MLKKLYLHHFRNYEEKRLDFFSRNIILCGANGIGKTNILEAIHYLGILRSFKNAPVREMVHNGSDAFTLMALFENGGESDKIHIEQKKNGERICFINDVPEKRASAILNNFRSVIFAPEDRLIISGTAAVRRRFFDILISLEDGEYLRDLQQYRHALAQRNILLKQNARAVSAAAIFSSFEELMAFHGERIMQRRSEYAELMQREVRKLSQDEDFCINYHPDWRNYDLQQIKRSLEHSRKRDMLKGFTAEGIQLDDFDMFLRGFNMRSFASSGQTRIYSLYLKMAEFKLSCNNGTSPIALVDDVTGELDEANRSKFFKMLERAEQTFFTFTENVDISDDQQVISLV